MTTSTLSSMNTISAAGSPVKFPVYLKGGAVAGVLAAMVNNIWSLVSPALGAARVPHMINPLSITLASIVPAILASVGFWIGVKLFKKNGPMIFALGVSVLTVLSPIGNFKANLPDGSLTPPGFVLLTVPMHLMAGAFIVLILLRAIRNQK